MAASVMNLSSQSLAHLDYEEVFLHFQCGGSQLGVTGVTPARCIPLR